MAASLCRLRLETLTTTDGIIMELSPRSMLLLKIYDHDRFKQLIPEQASSGTTNSGTIENSPIGGSALPLEIKLKPNYPMQRVEGEYESRKGSVSVVQPSFNILSDDLKYPYSFRERLVSSRKPTSRQRSARKKRHNNSVIIEKTDFDSPPPKSTKEEEKPRNSSGEPEKPRKSFGEEPKNRKVEEVECIKDTRIPVKDFIDISLNKGKVKTKSDFSTQQIKHYKSTFPDSITTSYFIKPGEPVAAKSQCLLMTQLSTTATANHMWIRHASRMRLQSMGTMSPSTVNYPLNEELPSSHLPHSVRPKSIEISKTARKAQTSVKFPPTHKEFSTFLNRVKETERVIRQEEDFARKVRGLKGKIQLEPTEHKMKNRKKNEAEEEPPIDSNTYFIVAPGKVPSSGLKIPRQYV